MPHLSGVVASTFLVVCLWSGVPAAAQSGYDLFGGGRTSALGYASTALGTASGVHANPAASALHGRRVVSLYARQSFGLSALRYGSAYVTWPEGWGSLSAGASTFGNDDYREVQYSLGFARALTLGTTRKLHVGAVGRYYHTRIEGYGSAGALGLHLGMLVPLLPSLQFGAQATNINAPSLTGAQELPQALQVGLRYRATPDILVLVDLFKDIAFPISLRSGVEVRPTPSLALRAGVTTAPTRFTGGVGLHIGRLQVHVAAEQHLDLGWTPSASIDIRW